VQGICRILGCVSVYVCVVCRGGGVRDGLKVVVEFIHNSLLFSFARVPSPVSRMKAMALLR
jgi:hypothetical protein